jgi:hypothetical protein
LGSVEGVVEKWKTIWERKEKVRDEVRDEVVEVK